MATKGFWARTRAAITEFFRPRTPPSPPPSTPPPPTPEKPGILSRAAARIRRFFRPAPTSKPSLPPRPPRPEPGVDLAARGDRVPGPGAAQDDFAAVRLELKKTVGARRSAGGKQTSREAEFWSKVRAYGAINDTNARILEKFLAELYD